MVNEIDLTDYQNQEGQTVSASTQFDRKKIDRSKAYEGHLMISVKAEESDFERPPVSVVLCLDRSGSMTGGKLEAVKDTARKIVENLSNKDEIAIIVYDDSVNVVQKRVKCKNKDEIIAAVAAIQTGGCTNMSGGLLQAINQINERLEGVKRVMLLTDGLANRGISDRDEFLKLVKNRDSKCTISTFGYGTDCDQELLADMAKAGEGNYYFISDEKDAKDVFARELGGLLSCMGQNITVSVKPNRGNKVLEVLNEYTTEEKEGATVIKADDIYAGETKQIIVKMRIGKPTGKPKDRPFSIARTEVSHDNLKSGRREKETLNTKVEFVKKEDADEKTVTEVAEQVAAMQAAKAQLEAVELANAGNFIGAQSVLRSAHADLFAVGTPDSLVMADAYEGGIMSFTSSNYSPSVSSSATASATGHMRSRSVGAEGFSEEILTTGAQKRMIKGFKKPSKKTKK